MNAYKFRTADSLDRVTDILMNRRLYCSEIRRLNDIREADIRVGNDRDREVEVFEFGLTVTRGISQHRVCSLCRIFDNPLLWAHYAGGSSGLAIEVVLPSDHATEVTYDDDFVFLSEYIDRGVDAAVRAALARKTKLWQYEQEVRVVTRTEFYYLPTPIQRVIVGPRIDQSTLHSLTQVCSEQAIPLQRAIVADRGIYTVGLQEHA